MGNSTSVAYPILNNRWQTLLRYVRPGPGHLLMYLAGRFQMVRGLAIGWFRRSIRRPTRIEACCSQLETVDIAQAVDSLKQTGLYCGLHLRTDTLRNLRQFCDTAVCYGNGQREYPFNCNDRASAEIAYGTRFSMGRYLDSLDKCSTLRGLERDATLLEIAREYLGVEPVFITARMWWSYPVDSESEQQVRDGQSFHYDLDDYRAISFFFYLSDVDEGSGPHVCVLESHRRKPLRFLLSPFKSKSDEQICDFYDSSQIVTVLGAAGSGFAEDLFCFHKGTHPSTRDRLLLQIRYRMRN
jgi:hypothetical protein